MKNKIIVLRATPEEAQELAKIESRIEEIQERHEKDSEELGALCEHIKKNNLHKKVYGYKSWDEYCKKRWHISTRHMNRIIQGFRDAKEAGSENAIKGTRARMALSSVPKDDQKEVAAIVTAGGNVTPAAIGEAARKVRAAKPEVSHDDIGYPIPNELFEFWERRKELDELSRIISKLKAVVADGINNEDPLWVGADNGLLVTIGNVFTGIKQTRPYTVCTNCNGKLRENCVLCRGTGFIPKHVFSGPVITEVVRKMRMKMVDKIGKPKKE